MSLSTERPNIGVFTNPKHEIYVGPAPDVGEPGPDDVIVHVRCTGICGSDIHFWKEGHIGDTMVVREEHILGHESSGDVVKIGSNVKHLAVGDRVAIEPGDACGRCGPCTHGYYNGCPNVAFKSTPPVPGLLRRYVSHPARLCFKIGNMSYEEGAILEPLSVALKGMEQSGLRAGDPTLITGAGPIGVVSAILAHAAGAAPIAITDIVQSRLDFIKKLIPSIRLVKVERSESPKQAADKIIDVMGLRPAVCLECTGAQPSIQTALYALQFRGLIEVIGVGHEFFSFPFMNCSVNEITMKLMYRYANTWPRAIRMVNEGLVNVRPLAEFRFKLEEGDRAFPFTADPKNGAIKVLITDDEGKGEGWLPRSSPKL